MFNKIKYFMSGVIVTLSTLFIFTLEADNDVEKEILKSSINVEQVNYDFKEVDWNNMFSTEKEFTEAKINSLKLKMKKCEPFEIFVNKYINSDKKINLYELHLFDNYYDEIC